MYPKCFVAASFPSAAVWPLLGPADNGDARFSHGMPTSSFIADPLVFQSLLKAPLPLICSALDIGAARFRPSDAASSNIRTPQIADATAKDEHAEYALASPQATTLGKKYHVLEGCSSLLGPPLSPQNNRLFVFHLQDSFRFLDLPGWSIWELSWAESNDRLKDLWTLSSSSHKPLRQVQEKMALKSTSLISSQICRGKQNSNLFASFQIQIMLISSKTLLQWVSSSDLVQDLKHALEFKLGIPSASQRLLHEGKQLEDLYPLSFYNIKRNASIIFTLRLRGGAIGQSYSAGAFSYKDVAHAQMPKKTVPPVHAPKPFLVDKLEETPSIEIIHPTLDEQTQKFAEHAIICRFNRLWPRTVDLYQWIHSNWTNNCKVLLCSKGFFIVVFALGEDYQKALTAGPWFWGSTSLFLTPWFPDFDPSTTIITKLPIQVRLPNLLAHLWHFVVFQGIDNSLGRLLDTNISRGEKGLYTFTRICAKIDMSKGLPDQINLKI